MAGRIVPEFDVAAQFGLKFDVGQIVFGNEEGRCKIEEPVLPRTPNNHIEIQAAMAANLSRPRAQRMIWLALQSSFV